MKKNILHKLRHLLNKKPLGVALLMVLLSLMLITAIVVDLGDEQALQYKLALNERDAFKAEALAESGLEIARIMLMIQSKVQDDLAKLVSQGIPMATPLVWQLVPIDSETLKSLISGDLLSMFGISVKQKEEPKATSSGKSTTDNKESFVVPKGGFGNFDGSFHVDIVDEESKISMRPWASVSDVRGYKAVAEKLYGLFESPEYDELFDGTFTGGTVVDRWALVGNLYDWVDGDDLITDTTADANNWGKAGSGSERSLYVGEGGVLPKNAYFDSLGEVGLVKGMSAAHLRAFGDAITIYGEGGKVNMLTASEKVLSAMVHYCATDLGKSYVNDKEWMKETMKAWKKYKNRQQGPLTPAGFVTFLQQRPLPIDAKRCEDALGTKSQNFTVKSSGTVGNVTRTMTIVERAVGNSEDFYYFRLD